MPKTLVINLVGRICLVKGSERHRQTEPQDGHHRAPAEGGERKPVEGKGNKVLCAVFLDARANRQLGLRKHVPLLSVPLSMVKSQEVADEARLTGVTFVNPLPAGGNQVDSLGTWKLAGQDIRIGGASADAGEVSIDNVPDLNAIVATVHPGATLESGILDSDPSGFGILARLWLPASATLKAITEDHGVKTFQPGGGHRRPIAAYVQCTIPFANNLEAPVLRTRQFNNGRLFDYRFDAHGYNQLTVTMSNICNCVNEATEYGPDAVSDDPEFRIYYQLVRTVLLQEPVPTIVPTRGARQVPVCFAMTQEDVG